LLATHVRGDESFDVESFVLLLKWVLLLMADPEVKVLSEEELVRMRLEALVRETSREKGICDNIVGGCVRGCVCVREKDEKE